MLQHVTSSRGWNITERVNDNVDNEIELGMEIPAIKSRILQVSQSKGNRTSTFVVMTNSFMEIHRDHHVCPDPINDYLPERSLGNV
jgi:hypothetical protein